MISKVHYTDSVLVLLPLFCDFYWAQSQSPWDDYFLRIQTKNKAPALLNGACSGEEKSLQPIRCVIDFFLSAGLTDVLIVAYKRPGVCLEQELTLTLRTHWRLGMSIKQTHCQVYKLLSN